jgi:hypothetical protein
VKQGGLCQHCFGFGDFQPTLVFADMAAEFVGDEMLDDGHGSLLIVND